MTATADIEAKFLPPNPDLRSEIVTKERTVNITHTEPGFVSRKRAKHIAFRVANKTHADNY